jgi:ArsR family transcriptional regulator
MRKQIVNKTNFKLLTPALTSSKIKNLQDFLAKTDSLERTMSLADIINGETRLKILCTLARVENLSVSDIADILKARPSGISHQLAILRENNLVKTSKRERVVLYALKEPLPKLVWAAVDLR